MTGKVLLWHATVRLLQNNGTHTHEKLDPEERAGKVMHFLRLAKQHLVFRKGNFIKAVLLES